MSEPDRLERDLDRLLGDAGRRTRFLDRLRARIDEEVGPGAEAATVPGRGRWIVAPVAAVLALLLGAALWAPFGLERDDRTDERGGFLASRPAGDVHGILVAHSPEKRTLASGRVVVWVSEGASAVIVAGSHRITFEPGLGFVEMEDQPMSKKVWVGVLVGAAVVTGATAEEESRVEPGRVVEADSGERSALDVAREVETWIALLGADDWEAREEASRRLVEIGEAALGALALAAEKSDDLEVRERAKEAARLVQTNVTLAGALGDLADDPDLASILERVRRNPSDASALLALAAELEGREKEDAAVAILSRAIEIDPRAVELYSRRGAIAGRRGDVEAAIRDFESALRLDRANASAYLGRGRVRADRGDFAGAVEDFSRAIAIDPVRAETYLARGDLRTRLGDLDGALADFARAIEVEPARAEAYRARADVAVLRGDLAGALADLDRAIELAPGDTAGWLRRSRVRESAGDSAGAIDDLARALRLDPGNTEAAERLRRLEDAAARDR